MDLVFALQNGAKACGQWRVSLLGIKHVPHIARSEAAKPPWAEQGA